MYSSDENINSFFMQEMIRNIRKKRILGKLSVFSFSEICKIEKAQTIAKTNKYKSQILQRLNTFFQYLKWINFGFHPREIHF